MVWSPPGVEVSVYQALNLCWVVDRLIFNGKLAVGGRGSSPGLLTDHRWGRSGPMSHHRLRGGVYHNMVVIVTQSSTRAKTGKFNNMYLLYTFFYN